MQNVNRGHRCTMVTNIQVATDARNVVQSGSIFGRKTDAGGDEGGVMSSLHDDSSALPELDEDTLVLE
jgi:hypothetical protein